MAAIDLSGADFRRAGFPLTSGVIDIGAVGINFNPPVPDAPDYNDDFSDDFTIDIE